MSSIWRPGNATVRGIEIVGEADFVARTVTALDLVWQTTFATDVRTYVKRIRSGRRSGACAWEKPPTVEFGRRTWISTPEWYAGGIVHEMVHCKLFVQNRRRFFLFTYTPARAWTGTEVEIECMEAELDALRQMNAPIHMQQYVVECKRNPTHHKVPYYKRDW